MQYKPKLIPVTVPWKISSVPQFKTWRSDDGLLNAIAFIAFFKLETAGHPAEADASTVSIVERPLDFVPSDIIKGAPYRLVRVSFERTIFSAMDDKHDFPENDFDWSQMPVDKDAVGSVAEYIALADRYLIETSTDPDPSVYEVENSPLLAKLGVSPSEYKHVILVGEDQFFDVVARGWRWEPGLVAD